MRIDFDQNPFCCVNVNLKKTGFVERRIKECEKALWQYRIRIDDIK